MEADIRGFLLRFSPDELVERGILLRGQRRLLQGASAKPLTELMLAHGITRLELKERGWWLKSNGDFASPGSPGFTPGEKSGDSENLLGIFNEQNPHINPYFRGSSSEPNSDDTPDSIDSSEIRFGLERDLQRALRTNVAQLEPGLTISDGGSEKTVEAGRIDITAEDANGSIVVIELKAGTALPDAITQLLAYMGTVENPDGRPVRGILVANDFAPRVVQAAKAVPNISLKAYSFQFSFQDR